MLSFKNKEEYMLILSYLKDVKVIMYYLVGKEIKGVKLLASLRASCSVLTIWLKQKYRPHVDLSSKALI